MKIDDIIKRLTMDVGSQYEHAGDVEGARIIRECVAAGFVSEDGVVVAKDTRTTLRFSVGFAGDDLPIVAFRAFHDAENLARIISEETGRVTWRQDHDAPAAAAETKAVPQ